MRQLKLNGRYGYDVPFSPCTSPSPENSLFAMASAPVSTMYVVGSPICFWLEPRLQRKHLLNTIETSVLNRRYTGMTYHWPLFTIFRVSSVCETHNNLALKFPIIYGILKDVSDPEKKSSCNWDLIDLYAVCIFLGFFFQQNLRR